DKAQYRQFSGEFLPPASYSLVTQADGVGVYSFCMCPGGIIAPCATAPGELVTNGWSPSKRNNPHANSGVVVEMSDELLDKQGYTGVFGALELQKEVEKACWNAGGGNQTVPAQRLVDFMKDRKSRDLPACSYVPGVKSVNLNDVLPKFISKRLKKAFNDFARKMPLYLNNDAVLVAPESRTSSPIRIPRDRQTFQHVEVSGIYPCAEGAGYAGGIVSAAMDGQKVVQAIAKAIH
ncbi:MAG: NAD(P)/FAD-dependent oxidoreductase, partial [Flavobacteriales bacterium]